MISEKESKVLPESIYGQFSIGNRPKSALKGANVIELLFQDNVAEEMVQSGSTPINLPLDYEYVPPEVGPEIYVGSVVALLPIIWATVEFTNRIRIQQQCLVCQGWVLYLSLKMGLNLKGSANATIVEVLPWLGWKVFFLSTFTDVGNGGVLRDLRRIMRPRML